jgi:hypothetical protein
MVDATLAQRLQNKHPNYRQSRTAHCDLRRLGRLKSSSSIAKIYWDSTVWAAMFRFSPIVYDCPFSFGKRFIITPANCCENSKKKLHFSSLVQLVDFKRFSAIYPSFTIVKILCSYSCVTKPTIASWIIFFRKG